MPPLPAPLDRQPLMAARRSRPRVLAIVSGEGHWEQLMRLRDAFADCDVTYATTEPGEGAGLARVRIIPDCNRNLPVRALWSAVRIGLLVLRLRPDTIVTTGALPGLIALAVGRRIGARTIWIDSIASAQGMSLAGIHARRHADLWMSQWPDVADRTGAVYVGSVL